MAAAGVGCSTDWTAIGARRLQAIVADAIRAAAVLLLPRAMLAKLLAA
jgi:hypothetical protein